MSGGLAINRLAKLLILALFATVLFNCSNSDGGSTDNFTLVQSTKNTTVGHTDSRAGSDCFQAGCHGDPSTSTKPHLTLAGTVYTGSNESMGAVIYPNVEVHLLKNGAPYKVIPVNNLGNFYTNDQIIWDSSLSARVVTQNGNSTTMSSLASSSLAGCNGCHDSVFRIYGP